jgi:hypothetical protein
MNEGVICFLWAWQILGGTAMPLIRAWQSDNLRWPRYNPVHTDQIRKQSFLRKEGERINKWNLGTRFTNANSCFEPGPQESA